MKTILPLLLVFLFSFSACKEKKPKIPKAEPVPAQQTIQEEEPPPTPEPEEEEVVTVPESKAENKFFLIAASFLKKEKAEAFQKNLSDKGYQSEILTRNWGANQDFYRVSFQGFTDKQEALKALKENQASQTFEGVWLMIR